MRVRSNLKYLLAADEIDILGENIEPYSSEERNEAAEAEEILESHPEDFNEDSNQQLVEPDQAGHFDEPHEVPTLGDVEEEEPEIFVVSDDEEPKDEDVEGEEIFEEEEIEEEIMDDIEAEDSEIGMDDAKEFGTEDEMDVSLNVLGFF